MGKKKSATTSDPVPPAKNWWLIAGSVLMELATAIWVQKHGTGVPDWVMVLIFLVGAIPALVAAFRFERFMRAGGKVREQIEVHPISFGILCACVLVIVVSIAGTFLKRSPQFPLKNPAVTLASPPLEGQRGTEGSESVNQGSSGIAKENQERDSNSVQCPNGYTILRNVTASRSQWDHAKTTGFYFAGPNPCIKVEGAKSSDNTVGYKFSNDSENSPQTISADHGIAIGGNARVQNPTVNNYGLPERHLTPEQRNGLIALATSLPKECTVVFGSGDSAEPEAYAKELHDLWAKVGTTREPGILFGWHPKGIYFQVKSGKEFCAPYGLELVNGMKELGFATKTANENPQLSSDAEIQVLVGDP